MKIIASVMALLILPALTLAMPVSVNQNILLNQHKAGSKVYMLYNTGKQPLWLVHEKAHPSASAGWSSKLDPKHWSAILMSKKNFILQCQLVGSNKPVHCRNHVQAYLADAVLIPKKADKQSYWLVENMTIKQLIKRLSARGFHRKKH